ncbi:hypothetical protein G7Y89_g6091 [Cudoniella acicularis]|uniref:Ankyrin n=1 Tax=Cudoniella acicularis TaxID=354080 RepID=A0A8H4RND5_9HELO|nr:hypothetical protein G7Y89_g6091 [Cudoniella acicularis]
MDGSISQNPSGDAPSTASDSAAAMNPNILPRATRKRKYGHRAQVLERGSKRQKIMGRPRNGWTPTRLRKLVRLYLMTNLDVVEISKVLRTKDFKPCKRDVQEQLKNSLQTRPDKIRAHGPTTKMRLQFLRECKRMRKERRQSAQPNNTIEEPVMTDTTGLAISGNSTTTSIPENPKGDWAWLDLALSDDTSLVPENAPNTDIWYSERIFATDDPNYLPPPLDDNGFGIDFAMPPMDSNHPDPDLDNWFTSLDSFPYPPSINNLPLLDVDPSFIKTNVCPSQSHTLSESPMLCPPRPDSPTIKVKIASSHAGSDSLQNSIDDPASKRDFDFDLSDATGQNAASVLDPGGKSSRASILTVSSLRKRLSFKYSDSYLGDILSLMQNLTIAGSSDISARGTARSLSKALSTTVRSHFETAPPLPSIDEMLSVDGVQNRIPLPQKKSHPVILPGAFPTYCWAQINNNKLRPCRHSINGSHHWSNCRPTVRKQYKSTRSNVFSHILTNALSSFIIDEVDTFGNSEVHIAAACQPGNLLPFFKEGLWNNEVNNAGQTFLHLVQEPSATNTEDLCDLLKWLPTVGFNFNLRDHHGQTALHLLTRPWIPQVSLDLILNACLPSMIPILTFRDNLGYTIKEQMIQAGCSQETFDLVFPEARKLEHDESHCLPNYGSNTAIETLEDLTLYAQHAELLRDIRNSLNNPLHEDANGCNGLHCLAEVSLSLPLPEGPVSSETEDIPETPQTRRERYLEGLLKSGVDINNHDKKGLTPLMAFIIHRRAGEDDALTTRLLQLLFDAGAGINTRNRQGETALHLAVKLGRRADTKFLLSHGANVYARDVDGQSVIALGEAASKKAKQNETLYAQIILCISLVVDAESDHGAKMSPLNKAAGGKIVSIKTHQVSTEQLRVTGNENNVQDNVAATTTVTRGQQLRPEPMPSQRPVSRLNQQHPSSRSGRSGPEEACLSQYTAKSYRELGWQIEEDMLYQLRNGYYAPRPRSERIYQGEVWVPPPSLPLTFENLSIHDNPGSQRDISFFASSSHQPGLRPSNTGNNRQSRGGRGRGRGRGNISIRGASQPTGMRRAANTRGTQRDGGFRRRRNESITGQSHQAPANGPQPHTYFADEDRGSAGGAT